MARQPTVPILAGTGGGITPPQSQIRPEFKVILDVSGGLNTGRPPDQVDDKESPDCLNVAYMNNVLCVDFGFKTLGHPVYGIPQQPIQWTSPASQVLWQLLVTTRTLLRWNQSIGDWQPVSSASSNPASNALVTGAGSNPAIPFSGSASWVTGQLIAVAQDNGLFLIGPAGGTTSPVTLGSPLPVGRTIPSATTILALPTFTSDGSLSISWASDPTHAWIMFTNGFDLPQRFDGTTCQAIPNVAGVLSTARRIARFHGVTVLGATTEGGQFFGYRIRRSATNDPTNWTTLDSGFDDLADSDDNITDLVPVNPYLICMRRQSIVRASYYGIGLQVFWYDYGLVSTGTIADKASAPNKTNLTFVSESGIFLYDGSYGLGSIGDKIFQTMLSYTGELNLGANLPLVLLYVPVLDETWVLHADNPDAWPRSILRFKHSDLTWWRRRFNPPFLMAGIGFFTSQVGTTWLQLAGTRWIDRHRPWAAQSNQALFRQILFCGQNGQVYVYDFNTSTTEAGQAIYWYYTTRDYPIAEEWKTADGITLYGKGICGLLEMSTDGGIIWNQLGSNLSMGPAWSRVDVSCSFTTDYIRLRFSGTDPSFKLSWFAFKTMSASEHR